MDACCSDYLRFNKFSFKRKLKANFFQTVLLPRLLVLLLRLLLLLMLLIDLLNDLADSVVADEGEVVAVAESRAQEQLRAGANLTTKLQWQM